MEAYGANPDAIGHDVVPVIGEEGELRLRVGVWRVLFVREDTIMRVREILHRREAYR